MAPTPTVDGCYYAPVVTASGMVHTYVTVYVSQSVPLSLLY